MPAFICLLVLSSAFAAMKPICNESAVTKNCQIFAGKQDQVSFELSDGTTLKGPNANTAMAAAASNLAFPSQAYAQQQSFQAEILEILDSISMPTASKLDISTNLRALFANPEGSFNLHWSPGSTKPTKKFTQALSVIKFLKEKLNPENFKRIQNIAEKMNEETENAQAAFMKQAQSETSVVGSDKRKQRGQELFNYAKEKLTEIIRRGRNESELTQVEKNYIEKLKTVKLNANPDMQQCPPGQEQALYTALTHSVSICPATYASPDSRLVLVLAHEIAHSFDPCNSSNALYQVDESKMDSLPESLRKYAAFSKGDNYINMNLQLSSSDPSIIDGYLKAGFYKEVVPITPADSYLFKREYECMTKNQGFRENTPSDTAITASYLKRSAAFHGKAADARSKEGARNYLKALKKYPQCLRSLAHSSEMNEVMSDMLGTLVAEKFISENPPKTDLDLVGYLPMTIKKCSKNAQSADSPNIKVTPEMFANFALDSVKDPHPSDAMRAERIYMNLPGMAAAFNCRRGVPKCFDHLSLVGAAKGPDNHRKNSANQPESAQ